MSKPKSSASKKGISRDQLADLLNEDLSREYQAIIAYVVYSQVLSGAEYMDIASQLEIHAKQELDHALILARQIDYLGKMPVVTPKAVRTSKNPKDMLRYDLDNENETIRNYRDRIRQCEELGEYGPGTKGSRPQRQTMTVLAGTLGVSASSRKTRPTHGAASGNYLKSQRFNDP